MARRASADLVGAESFDGEVLAELSVDEVVSSELAFPVTIGIDLVNEHRTLLAAVPRQIALTVAVNIEPAHPARSGNGILEHPGEDGLPCQGTSFGSPTFTESNVPTCCGPGLMLTPLRRLRVQRAGGPRS